jgi:hypothetical protein
MRGLVTGLMLLSFSLLPMPLASLDECAAAGCNASMMPPKTSPTCPVGGNICAGEYGFCGPMGRFHCVTLYAGGSCTCACLSPTFWGL